MLSSLLLPLLVVPSGKRVARWRVLRCLPPEKPLAAGAARRAAKRSARADTHKTLTPPEVRPSHSRAPTARALLGRSGDLLPTVLETLNPRESIDPGEGEPSYSPRSWRKRQIWRSPSDACGNSFTRYRRQAIPEVVEQMGFAALTDEALIELAIKHWHDRQKILGDWCRVLVTVRQQCTDVNPPNVHAEPSQRIRIVHEMLSHISGDPVHAEDAMKTRRFLIVVLFVFTSAPLVWANDQ